MNRLELNKDRGLVFNIQKFSLHDGPGIRTAVFLKGCPLNCQWCSNPESINPYPEIMTYDMRCIKCGTCVETCPRSAITIVGNVRRIDRSRCDLCLKCAIACPARGIEVAGKYMTPAEVVKEVEKDKPFYQNSGGGVTFSGGEPLVQWQFLREICKLSKERGISTALETTGCVKWAILDKVLENIDLVLYDVKHLDPLIHTERTGGGNSLILENIGRTAKKVKSWLRVPVIPGFNDSPDFFSRLGEFVKNMGLEKVSLLPYHTWGEHKYEQLGRVYPLKGIAPLQEESLRGFKEILESHGLSTTVGW